MSELIDSSLGDIAVIAASFKLPGISHAGDFWNVLSTASTTYNSTSSEFWLQRSGYFPQQTVTSGCIDSIDLFNPDYFGIIPKEVLTLDPQQRLSLLGTRDLLESIGFKKRYPEVREVGVFLGASGSEYRQRFINKNSSETVYATTGTANSVIAGRISYQYDFTGPSLVIDTACSSSLVAVALAVSSLQRRECKFAIAGGINLLISLRTTEEYAAMGMTSPSGINSTFADDADGYVRGEGYGFVLLKPLQSAIDDNDHILGVIASAVTNQDGTTNGITAPNGQSQISLINKSLDAAGIKPSHINYHECHGTATKLGDLIELRSLNTVFGTTSRLAIGSVKANIGHLEVAAGIAGFLKALILLRTGKVPPHPWAHNPTKRFGWNDSSPLILASKTEDLGCNNDGISHIGISSFGFSGTNCHVILKNYLDRTANSTNQPSLFSSPAPVVAVSAPSQSLLASYQESIRSYASLMPGANLHSIAYTLSELREAHFYQEPFNLNTEELSDSDLILESSPFSFNDVAFVFDGQGCYQPGLGCKIWNESEYAQELISNCLAILKDIQYPHLSELAQALHDETNSLLDPLSPSAQQLFIAITEFSIAQYLIVSGISPNLVVGHSLGEYVAAVIAGKLTIESCLLLLAQRSLVIEKYGNCGQLLAVGASVESITSLVHEYNCEFALLNSTQSTVIGGTEEAIQAFMDALDPDIVRHRLNLTVAYHTSLASPIADEIKKFSISLETAPKPNISFISCLSGSEYLGETDLHYWSDQLRNPVLFADAVEIVCSFKPTCIIEISPRCILQSHIRQVASKSDIPLVLASANDGDGLRGLLQSITDQLSDNNIQGSQDSPVPFSIKNHRIINYDPFVPVCGVGGESYWYSPMNREVPKDELGPQRISDSNAIQPIPEVTSNHDTRTFLVDTFTSICGIDKSKVDTSKPFQRYGADSLLLSQYAALLSSKFQIIIAVPQLFSELNTLDKLLDFLVSKLPSNPSFNSPVVPPAPYPLSQNVQISTGQDLVESNNYSKPPSVQNNQFDSGLSADPAFREYLADLKASLLSKLRLSLNSRKDSSRSLADARAVAGFDLDLQTIQFPIVGCSADKCRITDIDGNTYIDLTMGFGVQLLGHGVPFIEEAIRNQLNHGIHLGPQSQLASKVSALITEITGHQRVAFCNTGTEAVMTAMRLARACTGRPQIAHFSGSYHGHFDPLLAISDGTGGCAPLSPGTPQPLLGSTLLLDYSDSEKTINTLEANKASLAAVVVEPVQSRNPSLQPFELLYAIERFCKTNKIIFIFDEVLTGFRVSQSGVQGFIGIKPDLTCYGKIAGGGLPIGIVAGREDVLSFLDKGIWVPGESSPDQNLKTIFFAGTFNKNPLTMASAEAILSYLRDNNGSIQQRLNQITEDWIIEINNALSEICDGPRIDHFSSFFRFVGFPSVFFYSLLDKGIYIWEGRTCFLSTAHTQEDLSLIRKSILEAVAELVSVGVIERRPNSLLFYADSSTLSETTKYHITTSQRDLLASHYLNSDTASKYNQSICIDVDSTLDLPKLLWAVRIVVENHSELYTAYNFSTLTATPSLLRPLSIDIYNSVHEAIQLPFDPLSGTNVRVGLLKGVTNNPPIQRVILVFPHFSVDGWSLQVIANEISILLRAKSEELHPNLIRARDYRATFGDYSRWVSESTGHPDSYNFWLEQLCNCTTTVQFPLTRLNAPHNVLSDTASSIIYQLPRVNSLDLKAASSALDVSSYHLCLSIFADLVSKSTDADDFIIATILSGQLLSGMHGLVGNCTSILPLRFNTINLQGEPLVYTSSLFQLSVKHWNVDFRQLIKDLGVSVNKIGHAFANVCFNFDEIQSSQSLLAESISYNPPFDHSCRWDLFLNLSSSPSGTTIEIQYNPKVISRSLAQHLTAAYSITLCNYLIQSGSSAQSISSASRHSHSIAPFDNNLLANKQGTANWILERIASFASADPTSIAIGSSSLQLSYLALHHFIDDIATKLRSLYPTPSIAAICCNDNTISIALTLACWRSGLIPFHLSPKDPEEWQLDRMLQAGCSVKISDYYCNDSSIELATSVFQLYLTSPVSCPANGGSFLSSHPLAETAYLLSTSGTTGSPKIVAISHDNLYQYVNAIIDRLEIPGRNCGILTFGLITPLTSDLGYTSIFPALFLGHSIHCYSYDEARDGELLNKALLGSPCNFIKFVPSHLVTLLASGLSYESLPDRYIVFGGDYLSRDIYLQLREHSKSLRIFNHYGPTETTVGVCCIEITDAISDEYYDYLPVGAPLQGADVCIRSSDIDLSGLNIPSAYTAGEIVISGKTLMLGYVDFSQPSHPLLNGNEDVSEYATGDIGFLNSDGLLFIVSRMSSIVKVKGYRVSISYLESVISRDMPSVQCVVVATAGVESRSMLNLVCVVESLDPEIRNLLKQTIRRKLPTYYHPKYYCVTDRLPLLPNGKYDRRRCLAIANEYLLSNDASVAPLISNLIPPSAGRDTETIHWDVFASFVSDILKLEPSVVVPDANFIHLGGDSIDAIRLSGLLRDNGFAVSALNILDSNTLSDLYESHHDNAGSPSQGINSVSSGQVSLLPLTPSQQRFIHIKQPDPDRWAMTALVRLDGNLSNELIAARISSIVRQSASLQYSLVDRELVFTGQASTLDYSPCEDIVVQDILSLAQPDNKTAHTITSSLLAGLSLSKSRYITWARITPSDPDHRYSCVLLAVHHFFFDAISLSLLVDVLAEPSSVSQLISDPSQLYQILTSSYTIDDSVHATFASYSADLTTAFMRPLHWDSSYSQEQYMSVSMSLSVPLADSTEPPGRFGYLPLFLASLEDSVAKLFNSTCVAVDVETHGRDMNSQYFGTMGVIDYFTCHTPLVLRDQQSNHVDPFHYYSDALSALGRAAINFNLIVASNSPSVVATHPAISINYIPLAAQNSGEASLVIAYDVGASSSPEFLREYPIQFIILETSSGISVRLEYVESLLNDEVISRMLSSIQSSWGILSTQLALGEVCGSSEDPDRLKDDDEQDILTRLFGNP